MEDSPVDNQAVSIKYAIVVEQGQLVFESHSEKLRVAVDLNTIVAISEVIYGGHLAIEIITKIVNG